MFLIMIDDSEENKKCRRDDMGHLIGVGAAVFPEEGLACYSKGVRSLRIELGIPPDVELKWSPDDGSWLKSEDGKLVRTPLRKRMLALAAEAQARALVVIWDRGRVPWTVEDARREVLKYLYDKVSMCLGSWERGAVGIVIADEPGGGPSDKKAWLAATLPLTDDGTYYTNPEQIVLPIVTAPSHHVPHLQLADLIVGVAVGAVAGNKYALDLIPDLLPIIHRNRYGRMGGAGLTLWPPELGNLYHHILGDDCYVRQGTGIPLPRADWHYVVDDGL